MSNPFSYAVSTLMIIPSMVFLSCQPENSGTASGDIDLRLSRLAQVPMAFDASNFSPSKKELLRTLIDACTLLNEAYLRQYYPKGVAIRDSLRNLRDDGSQKLYRLIVRNGGPFDKMDEFHPFFGARARPAGGGFYPEDLTKEEFEQYVAKHPNEKDSLLSPYTVVRRNGDHLAAVPFHEEYAEWIRPASDLLKKASGLAENPSLKRYLASRAEALLTDDFYQSDLDWIDLNGNDVDVIFAPYEVYDDGLMAIKASYEATVGVKDDEGSDRLEIYTRYLEDLERSLPYDDKYKRSIKGLSSPMVVVTDIIRAGDIATGYQPVAANLPNDPRVHVTKGTKKTFWKNMMDARVQHVVIPIGRELIASNQIQYITPQGLFNFVLLHELCHALGPRYVYGTGDTLTVNQAFKDLYPALEEGKADVAGLHSMRFFLKEGILPAEMERQQYVSYLASLFRTIRFGTTEAHGLAAISEINFLRDRGGVLLDSATGKWSVNFERIGSALTELAGEWLTIQATGDYDRAKAFFAKWGKTSKEVETALAGLSHVPVDVEPVYSVRWD